VSDEDTALVSRAYAAWYRWCTADEATRAPVARIGEAGGKRYVVLRGARGHILRVYRVRNDGMLKGLKRWPRELEDRRNEHS
jgi:hypothetical protein